MDASELTIFHSAEDIEISCLLFLYYIIAKYSYGKTGILEVKQILSIRFQFKSNFVVSILDH